MYKNKWVLCFKSVLNSENYFDFFYRIMQQLPMILFLYNILMMQYLYKLPSVLWCCWLGSRKGIRPVKTEWRGAGMVICLERDADLHIAQLMPLPLTVCCFSKIQIGFTFLLLAHTRSPGKGPSNGCVCVLIQTIEIFTPDISYKFRWIKYAW